MFLMNHDYLNNLGRGHQGNSYNEIGPVVSDKKIFSFLYRYIGNPTPGGHVFWRIMTTWTILVKDYKRNIPAKLYWNRFSGFWQEDFESFLYSYIGKIRPTPWRPLIFIWRIQMAWIILVEDHQRNISAKLYWNRSSGFWQEDSFSIYIYIIEKISPAPWRPCFLTNQNCLHNLGRRSPKEHFCKFLLKSVQWFLTRRFLNVLVKKSIFSSCHLDMQWIETIWTTLKEDQPRIIPVMFGQNPMSGLGEDVV